MKGKVEAVCISKNKGERKTPVPTVTLLPNHGIEGDAHAGEWHRQVSLLALESIEKMQRLGLSVDAGDFAENITTSGLNVNGLLPGERLRVGNVLLEVTTVCTPCDQLERIRPGLRRELYGRRGMLCRVLTGGSIRRGDAIERLAIAASA